MEGESAVKESASAAPTFVFEELSSEEQSELLTLIIDKLIVTFGKQILEIVPGVVSS